MNSLEKYIEIMKERTKNLNELEKIRYIYLDLGKRFSFNLEFAFGNKKTRQKIYNETNTKENLEKWNESNTITCKSLSNIVEYILNKLDINIKTEREENYYSKCPHVYNVVTLNDGKKIIIDLQQDLQDIQSHSRTKHFGLSTEENGTQEINFFELEQIDKKIGYIKDDDYYSDDYLYLMKSDIGYFTDLREKAQFIFENLEVYENKEIKYAERKWKHEELISKLFSKDELNKIHVIDCYKKEDDEKKYVLCIAIDSNNNTDMYMFSEEECQYKKMTIEQFAQEVKSGLVNLQGIPRLKSYLSKEDHIR